MADEGASPRELIIEACRRNNTDLLEEVITDIAQKAPKGKGAEYVAKTLNETRDSVGNGALHVAALAGNYEIVDLLLDQEGLEVDEHNRTEKDTPLHSAVRYVNRQDPEQWAEAEELVKMMVEAGCDPRTRNGGKLKPVELVDTKNAGLKKVLQQAEFKLLVGNDVVVEDEDDGPTGSASDSD